MKKALSHFLFTATGMGLGSGCAVIVLIARETSLVKFAQGPDKEAWADLFPTLKKGNNDPIQAIEAEFVAAATAEANPLQVRVAFDEADFEHSGFVMSLLKEAHTAIMNTFTDVVKAKPEEQFHDAQHPEEPAMTDSTRIRREMMITVLSRCIFALQIMIFVYSVVYSLPWEAITNMFMFLLHSIGIV